MSIRHDSEVVPVFELEDRWYHPDELREILKTNRLVPVEPPRALLPHLTAYDSVEHMEDRDRRVVLERLRRRWAEILAALDGAGLADPSTPLTESEVRDLSAMVFGAPAAADWIKHVGLPLVRQLEALWASGKRPRDPAALTDEEKADCGLLSELDGDTPGVLVGDGTGQALPPVSNEERTAPGVQAARPMQPTPYGLAGIEGDAIVIRLTADACAFAFANDPQAWEPRPPVIDKQRFLRDTLNELTAEREDGSTPLTDMLDRAMVKAMENGTDALDHDATGVDLPDGAQQR